MKPIAKLVHYAVQQRLLSPLDYDYAFNKVQGLIDSTEPYTPFDKTKPINDAVDALLKPLLDQAVLKGKISPDTTIQRDLFESRLMDVFTPKPSDIQKRFESLKAKSALVATDDFYQRSRKSNYIKMGRIAKNIDYKVPSKYGDMAITINLSKPEKDPKDIAKAVSSDYPKCLLCKENVGYYGHANHPGRTHHRVIKVKLNQEPFYFQYSPYVYYNEHAIVLHEAHMPMNIGKHTFLRLFDFVDQFPHYFIGSNAGLPVVGGSILSHEHYQGGRSTFPIDQAEAFYKSRMNGINYSLLTWPLSVIKLESEYKDRLIEAAEALRTYFETYRDDAIDLIPKTDQQHNAITPIVRKSGHLYTCLITLRNNRTSEAYPDGIFHPHPDKHHIKKENIGLIEVMGLAILPGRLVKDFKQIEAVLKGEQTHFEGIEQYQAWIEALKENMPQDKLADYIKQEAGKVFIGGLEDCGIFKQTTTDRKKFIQFLEAFIGWHLKL